STTAPCAKDTLNLVNPGTLTVGTDDPAYPPWVLKNDPASGKGYESAVAYEVADRLGFSEDEVTWVSVPFNKSYAPGPKDFDFDINQISVTPERSQVVTFSGSYYDVSQALIVNDGTPIASATAVSDLKGYRFGAQIGTTSLQFINEVIQPTQQSQVYDSTSDALTALKNGQIDGTVLDLPTASYSAGKGQSVVGQFESTGEHFGLLFEKNNPLVTCVNAALDDMRTGGVLDELETTYLADYLDVPTISST
ncbi:MAG: amino acid ABC transporter substrate-binding protein, partial [Actinobacteria bacterium]|nr:amino acid ABC transporter substrate-binding protein [Actinomycetota bacterium]